MGQKQNRIQQKTSVVALRIIREILNKDPYQDTKLRRFEEKLENEFDSAILEIGWVFCFYNHNIPILIEPNYPRRGADLKIKIKNRWINFEITGRKSLEDRIFNEYCKEVNERIGKIESHFSITIVFNENFSKEDAIPLIKAIKKILSSEKNRNCQSSRWYYISPENYGEKISDSSSEKASIMFNIIENKAPTPVNCVFPARFGYDETNRLKSKIHKKANKQLSSTEPNILALHIPLEILLQNAIYGNLCVKDILSDGAVAEKLVRDNTGLFDRNTRISAVVSIGGYGKNGPERHLFLNPMSKKPLTKEEIKIMEELIKDF